MSDQEIDAALRNLEQLVLATMDANVRRDRYNALAVAFGLKAILRRLEELRRAAR
jgi:hypothetical protein